MCNNFGVAGYLYPKHIRAFLTGLFVGQIRGNGCFDSTGIGAVKTNPLEVRLLKKVMHATDFLDLKSVDKIATSSQDILIGHNRAATYGAVSVMNAHPFCFNNEFVGTHNGTLNNKSILTDHNKFGTDSEALLYNIFKFGAAAVIPTVIGAYALVWYDGDTLNFLRNSERSLYYTFSKERNVLIWGSEKSMVDFACQYGGVDRIDDILSFEIDKLYEFTIPKSGAIYNDSSVKITELAQTPIVKGNSVLPFSQKNHGNLPAIISSSSNASNPKKKYSVPKKEYFKGYKGVFLDANGWVYSTRHGCVMCAKKPEWKKDSVRFIDHELFICNECQNIDGLVYI